MLVRCHVAFNVVLNAQKQFFSYDFHSENKNYSMKSKAHYEDVILHNLYYYIDIAQVFLSLINIDSYQCVCVTYHLIYCGC